MKSIMMVLRKKISYKIQASDQIEKIKKSDCEDIIEISNQEKFDLLS